MIRSIIAFIIALSVSFAATPLVIKLAKHLGAIDVPEDGRRVHKVPTPRLGGLAIFLGFLAALLYMYKVDPRMVGILTGAAMIVTLGFFDDIKPLPAKFKLLVQVIAAVIAIRSGVRIDHVSNPLNFMFPEHQYIIFGNWSYPLTLLWIVGVTNAINLVDGLDGLAAGISIISAVTLFVAAQNTGQPFAAFLASILAASTLGFLPYNFNPAKIFMGDTGALFLGYMLSVISVIGVLKGAAALSILVPIFAIGLPIYDTLFAMVRRASNGKSMIEADKGHLHHKLLNAGMSQRQAVITLYSISAVLGFSAVVLVEVTLKVAFVMVFAVFLLASMGARYLSQAEMDQGSNKADL
ncbi:MAG: undecaprenyl/decaprenyl-phosphate alpha-N-acetylglucosaminyl 1-phosphate transferase [Gracilibacteraceae bacterium]|jgi:UDP-GlcNAc:undecaprenyl-phosphate GlcNAc-1-phosphate transferase|nr:undecaprenyl/decaprenyl-phosphate alpha-N-acetylglucosaminyl 1-phosphate transferase [Gracilibacteraceae bacterium]